MVWTGKAFLAVTEKREALVSTDGLEWTPNATRAPGSLVRPHDSIYGWNWPPSQIQRSRDGLTWEPVPNEKNYFVIDIGFGNLSGKGAPPKLPAGP